MLMKRRSSPLSSTSRSRRPGNWRSRSATTSSTVPAFACTSALPFVTCRSGVGIRTVTGILVSFSLFFRSPRTVGPQPHDVLRLALPFSTHLILEISQRAVERREGRLDLDVRLEPIVERVRGLEPVAGDADDHGLVTRDDTRLDELLRRGDGHAAGCLGENAFRPRQQQHALDDLRVRGVLAEAA